MLVEQMGITLSGLNGRNRRHRTGDEKVIVHSLPRKTIKVLGWNIAVRRKVVGGNWFRLRSFQFWCGYIDDSCLDAKLELCFGGTIQLLPYGRVLLIERDVGSSAIRVAFEDDILGRWNCE